MLSKKNVKYAVVWLLSGIVLLTACGTDKSTPMQYKKSRYKFTQTEDGHIIKDWKSSVGILAYVVESRKNGKLDGFRRFYDVKDGRISREMMYKDGELHGLQRSFDKKGNVTNKRTYKNGHAGYGIDVWYVEGKLYQIRNYEKARLHGRSRDWYINSDILQSDTMYKRGQKHGMEKIYRQDGTLLYTVDYVNGKRDGYLKHYTKAGRLKYVVKYHKDIVWSVVKYLPNGKKLDISSDSVYITEANGVVNRG